MRILYVFPHPDDESFGPGPAIARQRRLGHEVFLLTLTRGGATKERHRFGYSIAEMGQVRSREMEQVARALGLTGLEILDLPDSGLKDLDPLEIERVIEPRLDALRPDIVITYPVEGISGFPDHLVCHAVVKRLVAARWAAGNRIPKRLAFWGFLETPEDKPDTLHALSREDVDVLENFTEVDLAKGAAALACYETYAAKVAEADPLSVVTPGNYGYELFAETFDPPLDDVTAELPS